MNKALEALNKIAYCYGYDENIKIISEYIERLQTSYLENILNEESKEYIHEKLKTVEQLKKDHEELRQKYANLLQDYLNVCRDYMAIRDFKYTRLDAFIIIKKHKLLNYVLKNSKCAKMYHLELGEINKLKEALKDEPNSI